MKKLFLFTAGLCLLITLGAKAQSSFPVPPGYVLKEKADYAKYNQDVINTIDWLQQTPWGEQPEQRKQANTFLVAWLTGSPDVNIDVRPGVMKLCDKNKELLITFMGGYAKYAIQHKDNFTADQANTAAVQAVLAKYQTQPDHVKDSYIERLIKIQEQGKLNDWITTDFNKS
jgi:hypothetical protein